MNLITHTLKQTCLGTPYPLGAYTFYPLILGGDGCAPYGLPKQGEGAETFNIHLPRNGLTHLWHISNSRQKPVLLLESVPHSVEGMSQTDKSDEELSGVTSGRCIPGISTLIPAMSLEWALPASWFSSAPTGPQSDSSFWGSVPPLEPDQKGWLCLHENGVMGFDLFDCTETLEAAMPGLYEDYATENSRAYLDAKVASVVEPEEALELAQCAKYVPHSSFGAGDYYRVISHGLLGYALILESDLVHLSVVPSPIFHPLRSDRAHRQQRMLRLASLGRHVVR